MKESRTLFKQQSTCTILLWKIIFLISLTWLWKSWITEKSIWSFNSVRCLILKKKELPTTGVSYNYWAVIRCHHEGHSECNPKWTAPESSTMENLNTLPPEWWRTSSSRPDDGCQIPQLWELLGAGFLWFGSALGKPWTTCQMCLFAEASGEHSRATKDRSKLAVWIGSWRPL